MRAPHIFSHYYSITNPFQARAKDILPYPYETQVKSLPFFPASQYTPQPDVAMLTVYVGMDPFLYITDVHMCKLHITLRNYTNGTSPHFYLKNLTICYR